MKELYEQIIEGLRNAAEDFLTDAYGKCTEFEIQYHISLTVDNAEKIIYKIASDYNDGWILTSERLPEEPKIEELENGLQEYAVMIEGWERVTTLRYMGNGEWYREGVMYNVIAWQPLPDWNTDPQKYAWDAGKRLYEIIARMYAGKEKQRECADETIL